jgi:hypothetical protein
VRSRLEPWMKEERDNTSRGRGLPTLPSLYLGTFQPLQRNMATKKVEQLTPPPFFIPDPQTGQSGVSFDSCLGIAK